MSAASANQVSGARPDAVSQPGNLDKPGSADGSNRDPRQGIQTGGARGDRPATVIDAKTAAALALAARGLVTSSDTTASAPTTLGTTARAILALLAQYPEAAPAVQGRAPLWTAPPSAQPPGAPAQQAGQPASQPGAPGQPTAAPAAGQAAAPAPAPPPRRHWPRLPRPVPTPPPRHRPPTGPRAQPDRAKAPPAPGTPKPRPTPPWLLARRRPRSWARRYAPRCRLAACSTNRT
ncbi:ortholog of Bordetella pertussis (BX470248) BP1407 [Achromobacter xylosoxidans NH44784-1996]|nr:ortholog of Bordetella pertussis (BX470248) BP1407 [Achromobacter xylosoxidans NH44784-1996]